MPIICLDFGTSSIRAALLGDHGDAIPLQIAPNSQIDDASIPSAIFVSDDAKTVYFGIDALRRGLKGYPSKLFENSPKKWLFADMLNEATQPAFSGATYSRTDLVAALLALAAVAARAAASKYLKTSTSEIEYRISHPVWGGRYRLNVQPHYDRYRQLIYATSADLNKTQTDDQLQRRIKMLCGITEKREPGIDTARVEEPVAAAIELIGEPRENERKLSLVVDVGAGTIDIACFHSLVPSGKAKKGVARKLASGCTAKSIVGAGDKIDEALIGLIQRKYATLDHVLMAEIRNGIRSHKETLFKEDSISIGKVRVSRKELECLAELKDMAHAVEAALADMLTSRGLKPFEGIHPLNQIDVIFAGGGADISFLRDAVERAIKKASPGFQINFIKVKTPRSFPATRERMAVAMGGTTHSDEWPEGRKEAKIPSLGSPLNQICA